MSLTPMMKQYLLTKESCSDCILFYRLGDFYEMFFDDAQLASKELELVLTGRDCGLEKKAPMCGIPHHAAKNYVSRLVNKGYKVAICEQMEDPKFAKGIVKRDIIKIVTPGTFSDNDFLEETKNNYVMSLITDKEIGSIAFTDITTGEFYAAFFKLDSGVIYDEISKYEPKEILVSESIENDVLKGINERFSVSVTKRKGEFFKEAAKENVRKSFKDLDADIMENVLLYSINGLLNYVFETQRSSLSNISSIELYSVENYLSIDSNSRRNLELTESIRDKVKKGSLLWVIDKTSTAMGGRRIRKWLEQPLIRKKEIEDRLNAVEELTNNISLHEELKENLKEIYDMERITGKLSSKSVNAKELISLKSSISRLPKVKQIIGEFTTPLFKSIYKDFDLLENVYNIIDTGIDDNPSLSVKEGGVIKEGYNSEIDELREAKRNGKKWISNLEEKERERTNIRSLKVSYNKVFGYYIEITKSNLSLVPEDYIRKQTLSNGERYITPELKDMEDKILGAEDKLMTLEYDLFVKLRDKIEENVFTMKKTAKLIGDIDSLNSLTSVALINDYVKPEINNKGEIYIKEGRHPVVEKMLPKGSFIANDTLINNKEDQLLIITGPNMAGKSTYMRQTALIVILAQMGSFVPAEKASISICDKLFTRIGASDDLSAGKSTFMVEMWEVSNILKNATKSSLILLDEVGRGTSTYDGLSIAWATIEYICRNKNLRSKTLFATHYHELVKLEGKIKGVKNYSIAVRKIGSDIVFLRKIIPGGADESYGIEVAKLAGLPDELLERAREILQELEENKANTAIKSIKEEALQLGFGDYEKEEIINSLKSIDIFNITPMEAMSRLNDIIKKAKEL
jgi:DNA mismatch repair protein MutS